MEKAEQMSSDPVLAALGLKAAVLYLEGKNAEAAEAARAALEIDETYEPAVRTLGLALALEGKSSEAREIFEKARDADPFLYADSCFGLGFVTHLGGQGRGRDRVVRARGRRRTGQRRTSTTSWA